MSRFRFTAAAERDLAEIVDYIADSSDPDRADAVLDEIVAAASRLAEMPHTGHTRSDLTDEEVLFWSVYSYLLVYRPDTTPLQIVRVVHGSRNPDAIRSYLVGS